MRWMSVNAESANNGLVSALPLRKGHFQLESGFHTDTWITLDGLFNDPGRVNKSVERLAELLRPYALSGVCGPTVGGAFLALLLAERLDVKFFYTHSESNAPAAGMFSARYRLPAGLQPAIAGAPVAVVDDMISAGSSVRATIESVNAAGATVAVIGCLTILGTVGRDHFRSVGLPLQAVDAQALTLWHPRECPLCTAGVPVDTP
jgi:orotate phosphoribosyltransferase